MKKIIVAIDGFSSCGKSTMAKELARRTGYVYVDSGAMYRAVALYCIENRLIKESGIDTDALRERIKELRIEFITDSATQRQSTYLNGEDVEKEIRTLKVSRVVSPISALDFVREALVRQQREMGRNKGIVMDGRDIGTTVFPDAELKIFVTATPDIRARRRYDELQAKGEAGNYEEILANVKERDELDQHRAINPLRRADDAIVIDNSRMTVQEQMDWLLCEFQKKVSE